MADLSESTRPRSVRERTSTEAPVWFPRDHETLFGVHNAPLGEASDAALVCVHNGGYNMSAHHNQMWTRLCRAVATDGHHTLRFDITGTGDSTGTDVRDPYLQAADDALAAVAWLRTQGIRRVALLGTCRGAMICLGAAPRVEGLAGVFLCAPPLALMSPEHDGLEPWRAPTLRAAVTDALSLDVGKRLLRDPEYRRFAVDRAVRRGSFALRKALGRPQPVLASAGWRAGDRMEPLRWLTRHRVPVTVFLGEEDPHLRQLEAVRSGELGRLIDDSPSVDLEIVDGSVHRFISLDGQERFLKSATSWARSVLSAT